MVDRTDDCTNYAGSEGVVMQARAEVDSIFEQLVTPAQKNTKTSIVSQVISWMLFGVLVLYEGMFWFLEQSFVGDKMIFRDYVFPVLGLVLGICFLVSQLKKQKYSRLYCFFFVLWGLLYFISLRL